MAREDTGTQENVLTGICVSWTAWHVKEKLGESKRPTRRAIIALKKISSYAGKL